MIDRLKSKLEELEVKKKEMKPRIDEINAKREEEIQNVNKKYDHMIYEINYEAQRFEDEFYNDLIKSFVDIVSREFDLKRSTSLYSVSDNFKKFKESISQFDNFPKELIDRLHQVIYGEPIDNLVYKLEDIKKKYLKS